MKLRTTVNVTHSDVTQKLTGGTKSGKVTLELGDYDLKKRGDKYEFDLQFKWTDEDGNELPNSKNNKFEIKDSPELPNALKALSTSINSFVSPSNNIVDRIENEILIIAKNEIISNFGVTISQIELI